MDFKKSKIMLLIRSNGKKRIASWIAVTLVAGLFVPVQFLAPASASTATTSCGTFVGGSNPTFSNVQITPLHGKAMYVNFRVGVDASYIGYEIENKSSSVDLTNLWLEVTNFTGEIRLANPADSIQAIGNLPRSSKKVIYILVRATAYSESASRHDVHIHQGIPTGTSSIFSSGDAKCFYEFTKVIRTLAASANKVTSMSVAGTSRLGTTVTVTVSGSTGQGGSGTASPDGSTMWISPASQSSWPTRALRLESTAVTFKQPNLTLTNQLMVKGAINTNAGLGNYKFTSRTTYVATYTFRIIGTTASNPVIRPTNHISSGTQIKFTGKYPTTQLTLNTSDVEVPVTSTKSVVAISDPVTNPTQANPAVAAGTYRQVDYKIQFTSTVSVTLDLIVDDPSPGVFYKQDSVRIKEGSTQRTPAEPRITVTNPDTYDTKLEFSGPFTGTSIELTYSMLLPDNGATYTNVGYGQIGSRVIGSNSVSISGQAVKTGPTPSSESLTNPIPKQPQVIDFPQPPAGAVGITYVLNAVASSDLPVEYESLDSTICTVSDGVIFYLAVGTCEIRASQPGNSEWDPATPVTRSILVRPGQVITFEPQLTMVTTTAGGANIQTLNVTASSGLAVTIANLTTDVCTVTAKTAPQFEIKALVAGECFLIASQSGNDNFGPATDVERLIRIGASQYIDFAAMIDQENPTGSQTVTATSKRTSDNSNTNLLVLLTTESPEICKFGTEDSAESPATINWLRSGLCVIRASQDGYDSKDNISAFAPADDVVRSFKIGAVPTVTVTTNVPSVEAGSSVSATVTVTQPVGDTGPTGNVTIYVEGHVISSFAIQSGSLSNRVRTFSVTSQPLGYGAPSESMTFSATYAGDVNFGSSQTAQSVSVAVTAPTVTPIVTTANGTSVTSTTATINGIINPNGYSNVAFSNETSTASDMSGSSTRASTPTEGSGTSNISMSSSLTELIPATLYFHRAVAAFSSPITIRNGSILRFVTLPGKPGTPTLTQNSTIIVVSFAPVASGAGVVIQYTVTCVDNETSPNTLTPVIVTGTDTNPNQANISGAVVGRSYTCTVVANSSAPGASGGGNGLPSDASTALPFVDSPYANTGIPTNISIDRFTPNGQINRRGNASNNALVEYGTSSTLSTFTTVDAGSITEPVADAPITPSAITGLTSATIHYYRVVLGSAPANATPAIVARAPQIRSVLTLPGAPTGVIVTFTEGTTGGVVSFTPPTKGSSVTLTYSVSCTSTGNSTVQTTGVGTESAGIVSLTVAGFTEDADYVCSVTATATSNQAEFGGGPGAPASSASVKSLARQFVAITDSPVAITNASFEMRGRVDTRGNSQGRGKFEFSTTADLSVQSSSSEQTKTDDGEVELFPTGLSGLNAGTIYYYRAVSKVSGQSNSASGAIVSVLTLAPTPSVSGITSSGTSITISFTFATAGPNVTLTFTVECTPVGGGDSVTASGISSPITVTGLTADTEYSCEVFGSSSSNQALHGGGRGNNSNASTQRTPAVIPPGGGGGGGGQNDNNVDPVDPAPNNPGGNTPVVPTEPTPRRDVSGTTVRTRGNTPRSEPVPGLLQNDPSRLPPAAQNITANKTNIEIKDGNVIVTPLNGWTGKMSVPVITNIDGEDREVLIEVIVEPELPESGKTTLNKDATTLISWEKSPSQVVRYEVDLNGKNVCTTTATSCSIPRLIGPKSDVKVTTVGNDEVKTTELKLPYTPPAQRVQALTVFFAENKAVVTPQARKDLNKIARILKREGFADLKLFGHTDGQSGARNAINLSTQRANIVQNYLLKKLGVEASRVSVAKTPVGEKKPAASNTTKAGQAKNRRTELWLR